MPKFKYQTTIDCKRGITIKTELIEFTAEKKVFDGVSSHQDQNKKALPLILKQHKKLFEFEKITVRGGVTNKGPVVIKQKPYSNLKSSRKRRSSSKKSSGGIFTFFIKLVIRGLSGIFRIFK